MSKTILQINFKFEMSTEEYQEIVRPAAEPIADFPGCVWKVWLLNEAEQEAGGIYLFESAEAVEAYLDSPIVAAVAAHPQIKEVSVKTFSVIDALTEITRGPVNEVASIQV